MRLNYSRPIANEMGILHIFGYSPLIGNLSIKMNKLPLIVKSQNVPGYFDVANIVQNVFRSDLEIDVSHKPTLLNSEVFEEHETRCKELRAVERELMTKEVIKLLHRNKSSVKQAVEENEAFSYNLLRKYCIIDGSNILPQSRFKHSLKRDSECQILPEKKPLSLPDVKLPQQLKIECAAIKEKNRRKLLRPIVEKSKLPVLLVAEPSKVHFLAYEVGKTYKRQVKLRCVGSFGCHFKIHPLGPGSPFCVEWEVLPGKTKLIAPGQCLTLKVSFNCQGLYNTTEEIVVQVEKGKDVVVSLVACRPDPFLIDWVEEEDILLYLQFSNSENVLAGNVDCGRHLVGTVTTRVITLLNISSDARFCFMSEESWYSMNMDLKEENILCVEELTISPAYFSLKYKQIIDIYISFTASYCGLHLAQIKLLCDNCTMTSIDLLAEAFTFNSEWIQFKNMEKIFDIDIEDDMEAEWYIDLGVQLCTADITHAFSVYNKGSVNLNYHWEIKKTNIPDTEDLPKDALNIFETSGYLLAKSQHVTTVHCNISSALPGKYRTLIVLIIDDLPRKCIEAKDYQHIVDESEENTVSAKVAVIEVWLECVKPCVVINPFLVDLSTELLQCGVLEFIKFKITNNSPGCICILLQHNHSSPHVSIHCEPDAFELNKFSSDHCRLIIEPLTDGFFTQIIKCIVNNGEVVLDLCVKGRCCSGYLASKESCVDFGIVKKHSIPLEEVKIEGHYNQKVLWILQELKYTKEEELKSFHCKTESINAGYFCHKGCLVYGNYILDNTNDTGIHCSLLQWTAENDQLYTRVLADVFTTDVSLDFMSYTFDKLYLNVKVSLNITARNHSLLPTFVSWGHPAGNRHNLILQDMPKETVIAPGGEETFELFLIPVIEGRLIDFYIPCFVELQKYPLFVQINGNVESLKVVFQWKAMNEDIHLSWPQPQILTSSSSETVNKIGACSLSWKDSLEECLDESWTSIQRDDSLLEIEQAVISLEVLSTVSSEPYLNWPIVGGKYTRSLMEDSDLERDFNQSWVNENRSYDVKCTEDETTEPQINHSDKFQPLSFLGVLSKQLVTQNVYLFNETEIESSFSCHVVQFGKICPPPSSEPLITMIQKKVYDRPEPDECFLGTDNEKGLLITVEPATGVLSALGCICLEVTVYALAWGDYSDTIEISVGQLPVLPLVVNVSCIENPVSIIQTNIRFGTFCYLDADDEFQMLRVCNNSCVPVYISWQMFVDLPFQSNPFSIILFDDFTSEKPFGLHLVPNLGIYCNDIFKMTESYTLVKPWCTEAIKIKFNPRNHYVNVKFDNLETLFKGNIIGHVFTDMISNGCNRKMGIELQPLEASIEASVQVPTISVLNLKNMHLIFKCKAWEVMDNKNKSLIMERVAILKNTSRVQLKVAVSITKPFQIHSICYQKKKDETAESLESISLGGKETCEMTITCKVTKNMLDKIFFESFNKDISAIEAAYFESGKITFSQPALIQEVDLEVWVYQPVVIITPNFLNFGPVCLKHTKHELLYIKSKTGVEKITVHIKSGAESVFSFNHQSEVNDLTLINKNFVITISFSPRDTLCYNDELVIRTCLTHGIWTVPLSGIGTWNFRDHHF